MDFTNVQALWMKILPSQPPLKMRVLSGEKAKRETVRSCLVAITVDDHPPLRPWLSDHTRMVLSAPPEIKRVPSKEKSIAVI